MNSQTNKMESKIRKSKRSFFLLLFLAALCTILPAGCAGQKKAQEIKENALKYYKDKYHLNDVSVTEVHSAGNSGLFGYAGVKDRAFILSDGYSVYWNDASETFADNAQSERIQEDFERFILEPLLSEISCPMIQETCFLNRTGFESYDESVFSAYYDGNIQDYLKNNKPDVNGWTIALETKDRKDAEREIQSLFQALKEYVSGWGDAYILEEGLHEYSGTELWINDRSRNVTARARLRFEEEISWYRQAYIEIYDGLYVTSTKMDFTFEEGDILLEEAGTCSDLQKMLDNSYYAMPVDAEENKNGGYMKKDRRHEDRVILDCPEAPMYRMKMSQRVLEALDSRSCIGVYVMDRRESSLPFMKYYGEDSTSAISVYYVTKEPSSDIVFDDLSPDYFYYFGTYKRQPYEGNP